MPSYVMRVWLADRPGALGRVATTIGAVGGDLVGIDILERGEGRVIDELTIDLPDEALVSALISSVSALAEVDVEDLRGVVAGLPHPLTDPVETAASLLLPQQVDELFETFVGAIASTFSAWAAVVEPDGPVVLARSPGTPGDAWLGAFVTGTRLAAPDRGSAGAANDVAWASLEVSGLALLVGRTGRPFRSRERRQLATLSRVADHRWRELVTREGMRVHPARHR